MIRHKSVLKEEIIEALNLKSGDIVVDATLGGGGHSIEIIKKILPGGKLVAIDQDKEAINEFRKSISKLNLDQERGSVEVVQNNFARLKEILVSLKIDSVNGIVADLGISSDQLDSTGRGFSFKGDGLLDMRMNQENEITAASIVNEYSEEKLEKVLRELGDEKYSKRITEAILKQRSEKPIKSTNDLVSIIDNVVPQSYKNQKIHFATKTFQALRIEVNKELENLSIFLSQAVEVLKTRGRLAVISFHSGEDKIVKSFFRENARGCICPPKFPICRCEKTPTIKIINKKPIVPTEKEIVANTRSRSAKLRIVEKI